MRNFLMKAMAAAGLLGGLWGCASQSLVEASCPDELSTGDLRAAGYEYGRDGASYRGGCSSAAEGAFLAGYIIGRRVYERDTARQTAQRIYDEALSRIDHHGDEASFDRVRRARVRVSEDDLDLAFRRRVEAGEQLRLAESGAGALLRTVGFSADGASEAPADSQTVAGKLQQTHAILRVAHEFARSHDAIDHCTDDKILNAPRCPLSLDAVIADSATGEPCVSGPGELRFLGREPDLGPAGGAHLYAFHPSDRGRPQPAGAIAISIVEEGAEGGAGAEVMVSCAAALRAGPH